MPQFSSLRAGKTYDLTHQLNNLKMSNPNPVAEREAAIYPVMCPECENELFDGTLSEITAWAKKNKDEDYLNYDELEEGYVMMLCDYCSWLIQM